MQYQALLATEDVTLTFTPDAVEALADAAVAANGAVENIGARRLVTVIERVLEETSFKASDLSGQTVAFDGDRVRDLVAELARDADLSRSSSRQATSHGGSFVSCHAARGRLMMRRSGPPPFP
jgi:ATP-dependent HslUV protease ATP-binding subunit HslU